MVVKPMLASLARELPVGEGWLYEPKFDGFRCLAERRGGEVELWSRNERPFTRYFPEIVERLLAVEGAEAFVLDGEIMGDDFAALLARLHPARSRVEQLWRESPACFVAFDLLGVDGVDLLDAPFAERRRRLCDLLPPDMVTPCTDSAEAAAAWLATTRPGIDGIVAKRADDPYQPDKRAMVKVKQERTADCVVAGVRLGLQEPVVASLLLGLWDGGLHHVGVCSSFTNARRRELVDELAPYVTDLAGHPWEHGFVMGGGNPMGRLRGSAARWMPGMELDWVPLRPELVAEVVYTQLDVDRFRHPARFLRWRPDRDAASCTLEQFG